MAHAVESACATCEGDVVVDTVLAGLEEFSLKMTEAAGSGATFGADASG